MSTLVLEDLNLISLHALLERLPKRILVGDLIEVIGDREIFSSEQADRIVEELDKRAPRGRYVSALLDNHKEMMSAPQPQVQLTRTEEIYCVLDELRKRLIPGHDRKGKFQMPPVQGSQPERWVNVEVAYGKEVKITISQPTIGAAFWPRPEVIDHLPDDQFVEVLNRTRDWVFTECQVLGLND